jgi:alpha-N-arabinofuranosidase
MTTVLPTAADAGPGPAYWVAGENCDTKEYIMKAAVYNSTQPVPFKVNFPSQEGKKATLTVLTAPEPTSVNVLGEENQVITTGSGIPAQAGCYEFELPNWSVAVLVSPM